MKEEERFKQIYQNAKTSGKLPWEHKEPTDFLDKISQSIQPAKALDLGCGSGIDSVYLAKQGWDVSSIDFIADAVNMTKDRAKEAGVSINVQQADVKTWQPETTFDLIVDAGLMHNMKPSGHSEYRKRLMEWLNPGGHLVLVHFEKQHALDWRPIGPRRWSRGRINRFFAPELCEEAFDRQVATGLPIIIGPTLSKATYWFKRVK